MRSLHWYTIKICCTALACYCLLELPSLLASVENSQLYATYVDKELRLPKDSYFEKGYTALHHLINSFSAFDKEININLSTEEENPLKVEAREEAPAALATEKQDVKSSADALPLENTLPSENANSIKDADAAQDAPHESETKEGPEDAQHTDSERTESLEHTDLPAHALQGAETTETPSEPNEEVDATAKTEAPSEINDAGNDAPKTEEPSEPNTDLSAPALQEAETTEAPSEPNEGGNVAPKTETPSEPSEGENVAPKEDSYNQDFVPSKKYNILLVGDSLMEEAALAVQRNSAYRKKYMKFLSLAKHSTGLTNGKYFNWPENLALQMKKLQPDFCLIFVGANDVQGIVYPGRRISFNTDEWKAAYTEICENMIDIIQENNAFPIWIGLPPMGSKKLSAYTPTIAKLQRQACENKKIPYLDSTPILGDESGLFTRYKKVGDKNIRIRKKDNCHITYEGTVMILDQVLPLMKHVMWNKEHEEQK